MLIVSKRKPTAKHKLKKTRMEATDIRMLYFQYNETNFHNKIDKLSQKGLGILWNKNTSRSISAEDLGQR